MKKTAAGSDRSSAVKHKGGRTPVLRMIGAGLIVFVLVVMTILLAVTFTGVPDDAPVLLVYGAQGQLPEAGFRKAVHESGFEYHFVDRADSYSDGKLTIPSDYRDKDLVIMTVGDSGFSHVIEFAGLDCVRGFVLVCPDFPGNASMEGINSRSPDKDIAIFAGHDTADSVAEVSGARLIYERISGDDTVFGSPVRNGGAFASDCYISTEQNRYLSLSKFNCENGYRMIRSPIFQQELADYLNVTYSDLVAGKIDGSKITLWYSMAVFSVFAGIAAFCVYFTSFGRRSEKDEKNSLKDHLIDRKTYLAGAVVASVIGMLSTVLSTIGSTFSSMRFILLLSAPVIASAAMLISIIRVGKVEGKVSARQLASAAFMTVTLSLYVVLMFLLFTDLRVSPSYLILIILVATAIDAIAEGLLALERRFGGICSGDLLRIVAIKLIPGLLMTAAGLITGNMVTLLWGMAALIAVALPSVVTIPAGRHSPSCVSSGIVHGTAFMMILMALL